MRAFQKIEALESFRQAVRDFATRQRQAVGQVTSEIEAMVQSVTAAEAAARAQVKVRQDRLQNCYEQAERDGKQRSKSCTQEQRAVAEAEAALAKIVDQRKIALQAAQRHKALRNALLAAVDTFARDSESYLSRRETCLRAYLEMRKVAERMGIETHQIAPIKSTIEAVRQSEATLKKATGALGEQVAAFVLSEEFGLKVEDFDQPYHGIDRVFSAPGLPLVVVESKTRSDGVFRPGQTKDGKQLSPGWIDRQADKMSNPANKSHSNTNAELAQSIKAMGSENVPVVGIVINPLTHRADVYTLQLSGELTLLIGDINVDEVASAARAGEGE